MSIVRPIVRKITRPITRDIICGIRRKPLITEQPQDEEVTVGQTATFSTAATVDEGTIDFQWQSDSGSGFADIPGETTNTLSLTAVILAQSGTFFRCVIRANGFTVVTVSVVLIVLPL